jgi:hypothetical protein
MTMTKQSPSPRFNISRSGRVSHPDPARLSCSVAAAQSLHDAVVPVFGRAVARQVINGICRPPFEMPLLFSIGTARRLRSLLDLVESAGRYVPSQGFFGAGDDYRMIEAARPPSIPAGLVDLPAVDLPRPVYDPGYPAGYLLWKGGGQ